MKWFKSVMVLFASLSLLLGGMSVAEAKRLGGGGSFGSKFSYSKGVQRKAAVPSKPSAAQTQNAARSQQLGSKGGMMGLLGGLAIGGLLGALFFGGAFENINLLDILIFGAIIFLLMKFMRSRQPQPAVAGAYGGGQGGYGQHDDDATFGRTAEPQAPAGSGGEEGGLDALRGEIPKGFNSGAFLDGARNCYAALQQAWDSGELSEIRRFTTDHVFAEIQDQLRARDGGSTTEVLSVEADLLKVTELGSTTEASVLFSSVLVEDGEEGRVEEVWHFVRGTNNPDPNWQLDGIQQVGD